MNTGGITEIDQTLLILKAIVQLMLGLTSMDAPPVLENSVKMFVLAPLLDLQRTLPSPEYFAISAAELRDQLTRSLM